MKICVGDTVVLTNGDKVKVVAMYGDEITIKYPKEYWVSYHMGIVPRWFIKEILSVKKNHLPEWL